MINFALIGDGAIAKYHRKAIEHVGGTLTAICDPEKYPGGVETIDGIQTFVLNDINTFLKNTIDYIVICSPSHLHREQTKFVLDNATFNTQIICEKPAFLPWEPIIDDNRINICLQLRHMPVYPDNVKKIEVCFVRGKEYFMSWKGDPKKTGGLFFNLFVHYLDLANILYADFEGTVISEGVQFRRVLSKNGTIINLLSVDMQECYNRMYEAILKGSGTKPKDLFYLDWILKRNSEIFGYGKNSIGKTIKIGHELL